MDGEAIRFGLNAVKSVGRDLIDAVVKERRNGNFRGLYEFCKRMHGANMNRRAVENLIKAGAFDGVDADKPSRRALLESVEGILKSVDGNDFVVTAREKVKVEGKKRPVLSDVDHAFQMDKVKYTKYLLSFK